MAPFQIVLATALSVSEEGCFHRLSEPGPALPAEADEEHDRRREIEHARRDEPASDPDGGDRWDGRADDPGQLEKGFEPCEGAAARGLGGFALDERLEPQPGSAGHDPDRARQNGREVESERRLGDERRTGAEEERRADEPLFVRRTPPEPWDDGGADETPDPGHAEHEPEADGVLALSFQGEREQE